MVDYDLAIYASSSYIANNPLIKSVEDLSEHFFIGYIEETVFSPLLDYLPSISPLILPQFRSNNLLAQLQAVREGKGIAVIPRFIASKIGGLSAVIPQQVRIQRTFYLLMHEDNKNMARVRAVANYIYERVHGEMTLFSDARQPASLEGEMHAQAPDQKGMSSGGKCDSRRGSKLLEPRCGPERLGASMSGSF